MMSVVGKAAGLSIPVWDFFASPEIPAANEAPRGQKPGGNAEALAPVKTKGLFGDLTR